MNRYSAAAIAGSLGAFGSYHIYRGSFKDNGNGFLQWTEEDITEMPQFMTWMNEYGKSYPNQNEFDQRFKNFQANVKAI